jgi:CBS domain-containing protein
MAADPPDDLVDEIYFERPKQARDDFDARLIRQPLEALPVRPPIVFGPGATVTDAMRAMQHEHRGCVVVTDDGSLTSKVTGIFTERDVLFRIVDRGRNPASLPLSEVMTPDPEVVPVKSTIAYVLNLMSIGGFRHVPVVDEEHRPVFLVSVRDVVEFLVAAFPREVLNIPTDFGGRSPRTREGA